MGHGDRKKWKFGLDLEVMMLEVSMSQHIITCEDSVRYHANSNLRYGLRKSPAKTSSWHKSVMFNNENKGAGTHVTYKC